jgi:hypothetical protein
VAEPILTLAGRWAACQHLLQQGLAAAKAAGDLASEAYFSHQQGTMAFCRDELSAAQHALEQALDLRERLGDEDGAAVTRHNLALLQPPAPAAPRPRSRRPRSFIAAAAVVLTILVTGIGLVARTAGANHAGPQVSPGQATPSSGSPGTPGTSATLATGSPVTGPSGTGRAHGTPSPSPRTGPSVLSPLSISPAQVQFGQADISPGSQPLSGTVSITNPNSQAVAITSISTSGDPAFSVTGTGCAGSLAANGRCTVSVQFAPHTLGEVQGALAVEGGGRSSSASLTGSGFVALTITIATDPKAPGPGSPGTVRDNMGLTTCDSACTVQITSADQTRLTLTEAPRPSSGPDRYAFEAWGGSCSGSDPTCTPDLSQDANVTAVFAWVVG